MRMALRLELKAWQSEKTAFRSLVKASEPNVSVLTGDAYQCFKQRIGDAVYILHWLFSQTHSHREPNSSKAEIGKYLI